MALSLVKKEIIKAALVQKIGYFETVDVLLARKDIDNCAALNKDNKFAQEGFSFMKDFHLKIYNATMELLIEEEAKLSKRYMPLSVPDVDLPPKNIDWIPELVWTEEAKREFCLSAVLTLREQSITKKRDIIHRINKEMRLKTLSESDKYYYRYYKDITNRIYEIRMKIIDEEYSKLLQGAS